MNYENYLRGNYSIDLDYLSTLNEGAYLLTIDGNVHYVEHSGTNGYCYYDELCYYYANYCNNTLHSTCIAYVQYCTEVNALFLVPNANIDFIYIGSVGTTCNVKLEQLYVENGQTEAHGLLEDSSTVTTYASVNANSYFTSFDYGSYSKNLSNNYKVIFDYSNIKETTQTPSYEQNIYAVRGENISFSKYLLDINTLNVRNELIISYGTPFSDIRNTSYQNGYSAGYGAGYVKGNQDGYNTGVHVGGLESQEVTAFNYIGGAFQVVSNVMALEVLPHITLGLCFSIPLVFVLIITIFKLVRK